MKYVIGIIFFIYRQFSYKCVMTNKDGSERKSVNKRKFLATLYNFLGGLGNALKFIYIKFSLL